MSIRVPLILSGVLVAISAGLAAAAIAAADGPLPMHYGIDGTVNRYGTAQELLVFPGLALLMTALFAILPRIDPRRNAYEAAPALYLSAWSGSLLVLLCVQVLVSLPAFGGMQPDAPIAVVIVSGAVSVLNIVLGNFMGKSRSNWMIGVKTPWTLSSEHSWTRTHLWTGRLFVAAGFAGLAASILLPPVPAIAVVAGGTIAASLAGVLLSYIFWKADPERADKDQGGFTHA